jgi:flagellar basal-body rod modification protein FlgD
MTGIDSLSASVASATASSSGAAGQAVSADAFLKLLVTQLQNQDPLNPMDNAEMTSQLAQINTVTGIENLNTSVQSLHSQFLQMQALQGASLVGRDVTVEGNQLAPTAGGTSEAGFVLDGPADAVDVEILNGAGQVIDTVALGALGSGRHGFEWDAAAHPELTNATFRVQARLGAAEVGVTPLMLDRVQSVGLDGGAGMVLTLERSGAVPYDDVYALN